MVTLAQLAPSKSSQLLAELNMWKGDVTAAASLSVDHLVLSKGDIDGLSSFIRGI